MDAHILIFPQKKGQFPTPKNAWQSVKDDYTRHLITQGRTPATRRTYIYNVAYFAGWMGAHGYPLISATSSHLELFVSTQLEMMSRSTAMNRLLACRSFYRYLVATRKRTMDPTARIPIKRDKLQPRRPFSEAELAALVKAAAKSPRREVLPILLLLIGSGCRRNELIQMHTDDIDFARGKILIHGKGSKERWVAPGPTAMRGLVEYVSERRGDVWTLSGDTLYKRIREIGRAASVVNAYPHRFRITFAVRFYERYGNLAALRTILGHESLRMAEHYAGWGIAEGALSMQASLDLASGFVLETGTAVGG